MNTIIKKKDEFDKFYTNTNISKRCIGRVMEYICANNIKIDIFIEPSAGNGAFYYFLPDNKKGYDICPEGDDIIKCNFFNTTDHLITVGSICYIGNPPFGKNSNLAINFFNFAAQNLQTKLIAFIVPLTFRKMSLQKRLSYNFTLAQDFNLPENSFLFNNEAYHVPTSFQIWERKKRNEVILPKNKWFKLTKKDDADIAIRRAGGNAGKILDGLDHNKQSTFFLKIIDDKFIEKYSKIDFQTIISNTVGTKSLSVGEILIELDKLERKEYNNAPIK